MYLLEDGETKHEELRKLMSDSIGSCLQKVGNSLQGDSVVPSQSLFDRAESDMDKMPFFFLLLTDH